MRDGYYWVAWGGGQDWTIIWLDDGMWWDCDMIIDPPEAEDVLVYIEKPNVNTAMEGGADD